ncbi:MAG: SRPBCC family protein [Flavobacteriales bacterium]
MEVNNINKDISKANTLDGDFYCSNEMFEIVRKNIFDRSWQFVCSSEELSQNNSTFPFYFLDEFIAEPLVLINNNNQINCFSNVCTHRGNILIEKKSILKNNIVCNYHGKSFNKSGEFIFMPESEGMKNFPCTSDNLTKVDLKNFFQFQFVSLDPIIPFDDLINEMESRVSWMPFDNLKLRSDLSKSYEIDANWALYCDNYLEGFHIPFIHKDLNATLDYKKYDVEILKYSNLQIGYAEENDICFDIPNNSVDFGEKIAAYYFWVFPNMMFNFYPWGISVNIIKPVAVKKTKIDFISFVWDEEKLNKGAGGDLDKVELEDEEIVQRVQKGVGSRFYKNGRFSPKMEKGVHHFHSLISKFLFK